MAVITYKCPNCDGGLRFDPAAQKFSCAYCNSVFTLEQLSAMKPDSAEERREQAKAPQDFAGQNSAQTADSASRQEGDSLVYSCPSCGAQIVTDSTTAATYCFYCHNPVVLQGRLDGALKPDALIAFKLEREEAVEQFSAWMKKRWFLPRRFFSKDQLEKITGVYFPYWVADCDAQGFMEADAAKLRVWRSGNTEYTETRHFRLLREGKLHFEDITKCALELVDKELVESVQPFDDRGLQPFSPGFLCGFQAQKRDIEQETLTPDIQQDVRRYGETLLRDTMSGYTSVTSPGAQINIAHIRWQYVLLPVWTLTYQSGGKLYYYVMNGQTGKTCGKLPVDKGRLAALFGIVSLLLFGLLTLGGYLL